ncbi:MAG: single-stranded DNA-binding protein [Erysipelotrichaceae bacterium]|nr:single-stranded DNA-binding protein [Erysipelotrichaceae bacterium]
MINQCVLVGRVKELPEMKTTPTGIAMASMVVEVDRSFRNSDGTQSVDEFKVILWRGIAETCVNCCELGSIVGIKGRLQGTRFENKNKEIFYNTDIIAEKVSFLTSNGE